MSASKRKAVRIAPAARSTAGAGRTGFCGLATRAAGARSMRLPGRPWRVCSRRSAGSIRSGDHRQEPAKTSQLCGVHRTTVFRRRHRFVATLPPISTHYHRRASHAPFFGIARRKNGFRALAGELGPWLDTPIKSINRSDVGCATNEPLSAGRRNNSPKGLK
jgi:hypothetical protein